MVPVKILAKDPCLLGLQQYFGGLWDSVSTNNWALGSTYDPPKWPAWATRIKTRPRRSVICSY